MSEASEGGIATPYDRIPTEVRRANWGWFGAPWPSGVCYDDDGRLREETRKPFPAGGSCLLCEDPFQDGDQGQAMPYHPAGGPARITHVHKECQFMEVAGPLAHLEKRCRHFGGESSGTPGLTRRQEALEVWRRRTDEG